MCVATVQESIQTIQVAHEGYITKSEKLYRARGSVYDIETSIYKNRSKSATQNVVKNILELISNMLQNIFGRSVQE